MPPVAAPIIDDDNRFFWEGVRSGRLLFQRCSGCQTFRHPPAPMCPHCRSVDWEPVESRGRGTIYSWVLSHHPSSPDRQPRIVVLVELDEGVRLVANLRGVQPGDVTNELPVEVFFDQVDGVWLPQFRPQFRLGAA
jgi:uncharacterized OB-fold protein